MNIMTTHCVVNEETGLVYLFSLWKYENIRNLVNDISNLAMTYYLNIRYSSAVIANPLDSKTKEINWNGLKKKKQQKGIWLNTK